MDSPSDEEMNALLETARPYTIVILRPGPRRNMEGADSIIWEHGRRNMRLRVEGKLAIVMPVGDPEISGLGVFRTDLAETRSIMADDPGVCEGVFITEFHSGMSFPGDAL
jgi:hypothetical protein